MPLIESWFNEKGELLQLVVRVLDTKAAEPVVETRAAVPP
jgi:hypothetical protein